MSDRCTAYRTEGARVYRCERDLLTKEQREARLCGRHLAAQRRRDEAEARRIRDRRASEAGEESSKSLCARLAAIGVEAKPYYEVGFAGGMGRYTGGVVIAAECASEVVAKLEAARGEVTL